MLRIWPRFFFKLRERRAADVECALEIDVDDGAEAVRRKLFRRAEEISGRAVDDDVDVAEALDRRGDRLLDLLEVAHVRRDGEGLAACRRRILFGRRLEMLHACG